jgi:heat shock factor-binding protein 1
MSALTGATTNETSADASTKLAEAIDDFLGDLEKKFKGISDEILGRLDDMAERCDRLEQEMVLRENSVQAQSSADGGDEGDGGR